MEILSHPETGALHLAGSLDIYDAEVVRSAIRQGLDARQDLVIDLRDAEACDTAGAQLLWSARRTAALAGKTIHFEHAAPAMLECWSALGMPLDLFNDRSVAGVATMT